MKESDLAGIRCVLEEFFLVECLSSYCLKYGRYDLQGTIDEFGTLGRFLRFLSPRYDFPNAFITSYRQLARKTVNGLGGNQPILRALFSPRLVCDKMSEKLSLMVWEWLVKAKDDVSFENLTKRIEIFHDFVLRP